MSTGASGGAGASCRWARNSVGWARTTTYQTRTKNDAKVHAYGVRRFTRHSFSTLSLKSGQGPPLRNQHRGWRHGRGTDGTRGCCVTIKMPAAPGVRAKTSRGAGCPCSATQRAATTGGALLRMPAGVAWSSVTGRLVDDDAGASGGLDTLNTGRVDRGIVATAQPASGAHNEGTAASPSIE